MQTLLSTYSHFIKKMLRTKVKKQATDSYAFKGGGGLSTSTSEKRKRLSFMSTVTLVFGTVSALTHYGYQELSSSRSETKRNQTKRENNFVAKCSGPKPPIKVSNRQGLQVLTPGHANCTLGWRNQGVNFGQNLEDAVILYRFFSGRSPLAHLERLNGVPNGTIGGFMGHQEEGFFLEMGALDGVTFSNTLMFEQCLGWSGLLVEAQPENFKKLQTNRPCALTIGEAVCSVDDGPTIRMTGAEGVAYDAGIRSSEANVSAIDVPCRPLSAMLEDNGIKRIDFFSLDVEGAELKVLQTLDWDKVKIHVLMVEGDFIANAGRGGEETDSKIDAVRKLVTSKGMIQVRSRLDTDKDPATGLEKNPELCQRNGKNDTANCMFLSIAGSDVFVSPELYDYDTKPWTY